VTRESCRRVHAWIDRSFVDGLPPGLARRLADHLAECDACRTRFDRLEAVLPAKIAPPLSDAAVERIAGAVLGAASEAPRAEAPGRFRWLWAGGGLAAAAAAAMALVFVLGRSAPPFRPRGVLPGEGTAGVRLHCVVGDRVRSSVHAAPVSLPSPTLRCTLDGALQLTYTAPGLEGWSMVAFSRDSSGGLHYYAPAEAAAPAVAVEPGVRDRLLDRSTLLGMRHTAGAYQVTIRFFDRPVSAAEATRDDAAPAAELHATMILEEQP
jgi:hypothetical protein